jgi:high affinity Mn2+ porin
VTTKAGAISYVGPAYNWTGFYAGGQLGYPWGTSNWTASSPGVPNVSGTFNLAQPVDIFSEPGSFFGGLQAGYNYMLPNRIVVGGEIDATFPSFPDLAGISIGGISNLTSPTLGAETYSETVLASGTVRGRIGYAPGSWLFYATGGFAWTYDQLSLTQLNTGATASPFLWRLGYAGGAGVEAPVAPHWTARLEYLYTAYGNSGTSFFGGAQRFDSEAANARSILTKGPAAPDLDWVNFHGQATFVWQGYPAIRSPYQGPNSLPGGGQGRETADASLQLPIADQDAGAGGVEIGLVYAGDPVDDAADADGVARAAPRLCRRRLGLYLWRCSRMVSGPLCGTCRHL